MSIQRLTGTVDTKGIKRCYLEDAVIKAKCPKCGSDIEWSGDNYLMYPEPGKDHVSLWCEPCGEDGGYSEFELPIIIVRTVMEIDYNLNDLKET